jgi:hypothetical protein
MAPPSAHDARPAAPASPPGRARAQGQEVTDPAKLLRRPRRRSFVVPVIVFGFTALLATIGINRLGPVEQPAPNPAPPKQREESSSELPSLGDPLPEQPKARGAL